MLVLALYLDQVFPGTYGLPKHPLFFLSSLKRLPGAQYLVERWCCCRSISEENDLEEDGLEAPDVQKESSRAHSHENLPVRFPPLRQQSADVNYYFS